MLYKPGMGLYSHGPTTTKKNDGKGRGFGRMDPRTKETIKKDFGRHEGDTGSSELQVALLSQRIDDLTEHLKTHQKDHSSRFGLLKMVSARRRLLNYLKATDETRYQDLIKRLKLRR